MSNKKSFILYNDFQSTLDKLTDEQAGKLLKKIFSYVNEIDIKSDIITDLVFEPIKQHLIRNRVKYDNIVKRNKENGKKGGRPKKNPKNPLGTLVTQTNPSKPKKADSDSDSDSVSDSDSDNIDDKKKNYFVGNDISDSEFPTLVEYQNYYLKYANEYYSEKFPISIIKCNSQAENGYVYWNGQNWKRKKGIIKSIKQTIENAVRKENVKLKDWETANAQKLYDTQVYENY